MDYQKQCRRRNENYDRVYCVQYTFAATFVIVFALICAYSAEIFKSNRTADYLDQQQICQPILLRNVDAVYCNLITIGFFFFFYT